MIMKVSEDIKGLPRLARISLIVFPLALLIALVIILISIVSANPAPLPGYGLEPPAPIISPIAAGNGISMVITEDGSLWAWGLNNFGQLADGTDIDRYHPVKIMDNIVSVSTNIGEITRSNRGDTLVAALSSDGTLYAWGVDIREMDSGGLFWVSNATPMLRSVLSSPLAVMSNVSDFAVGNGRIFAITSDGTLWGWGIGVQGAHQPEPVQLMDDVVASSGNRNLVITSDGTLWEWSNSVPEQVGTGIQESAYVVLVEIMENVMAVTTGRSHSFVIKNDGTLWGWGGNEFGQLGDGTTDFRPDPVHIMDDVIAVSAGFDHTVAITSDGALWEWGRNRWGHTHIMDNAVAVSAGASHTLAVTSDGALWAWGNTRLNANPSQNNPYPVRVMEGILLP